MAILQEKTSKVVISPLKREGEEATRPTQKERRLLRRLAEEDWTVLSWEKKRMSGKVKEEDGLQKREDREANCCELL